MKSFIFSLILFAGISLAHAQPKDSITLQAGKQHLEFTLAQLKRKLSTVQIKVDDPVYLKPRTWDAFRLSDLMKLLGESSADEIVFQAADGYAPSVSRAKLEGHEAYLAYQEHGRTAAQGRFEKVHQGKTLLSPAPFYLIWGEGKKLGEEYPWPYQLVKIELVSFKEKNAKIYPADKSADSSEMRGFTIFKNDCIRCHSVNLVGGDIGPELNTPKNVLEYWDPRIVRQFIHNPGDFRAKSKMPPFPQLKDGDLDDLFSYFQFLKAHRVSE